VEALLDARFGRYAAEYHVPVHAHIREIEIVLIDEEDNLVSPIGAKGAGSVQPARQPPSAMRFTPRRENAYTISRLRSTS
jgi:hypothetical protein